MNMKDDKTICALCGKEVDKLSFEHIPQKRITIRILLILWMVIIYSAISRNM